jgi:hypothetical protein
MSAKKLCRKITEHPSFMAQILTRECFWYHDELVKILVITTSFYLCSFALFFDDRKKMSTLNFVVFHAKKIAIRAKELNETDNEILVCS